MNGSIATKLDNQVLGVFDTGEDAVRAIHALRDAGLPDTAIRLVSAPKEAPAPPQSAGDEILDAFMSLLGSHKDHQDHAQAISRGHAMLVVTPTASLDRPHVIELLERAGAIDLAAKAAEWREAAAREPEGSAE